MFDLSKYITSNAVFDDIYPYILQDNCSVHYNSQIHDNENPYPLVKSILTNNTEIGKRLLEYDVNIYMPYQGKTPLELAASFSDTTFFEILYNLYTPDTLEELDLLYSAVVLQNFGNTKFLLEKGHNVNECKSGNDEPIFYAVGNSNLKIVQLLLEYGADVDKSDNNDHLLISSLLMQKRNIFEELMKHKPDLRNENDDWTVFDYAVDSDVYDWFQPYYNQMSEDEKRLYDECRVADIIKNRGLTLIN